MVSVSLKDGPFDIRGGRFFSLTRSQQKRYLNFQRILSLTEADKRVDIQNNFLYAVYKCTLNDCHCHNKFHIFHSQLYFLPIFLNSNNI